MGISWPAFWRVLAGVLIVGGSLVVDVGNPEAVSAATGEQHRIVYLDRGNNVWSARTDGSEARQLTWQGGFDDVSVSADGTRVVATGPYGGGTGIYLMSTTGDIELRSVSRGRAPAWSPDGSRFAFVDGSVVHIFDRNGGYQRSADISADDLRWSPDGVHLGYTRIVADPYNTGCPLRQLGWINANNGSTGSVDQSIGTFAWAGDGDRLLYVSSANGSVRSHSVASGTSSWLSSRSVDPCGDPFEVTPDGTHLLFLDRGAQSSNLIAINLDNGDARVYPDLPVSYPSSRLPDGYFSVTEDSRYVNLVRSFPTDIHRLDLVTGSVEQIIANDWRRVIGFSPDGHYYALLHAPTGRPTEMTIRDIDGGETELENVGWMTWQPGPVNASAALAWNRTWAREDRPVAAGRESRTWLWGPSSFDVQVESYDQAPGGSRAVRYYDKSRMEITNPHGDRSSRWHVTNGLLVRELISGRMQVGDDRFIDLEPASVPVAGDTNDAQAPTYATFNALLDAPPLAEGQEIRATVNRNGDVGQGGPGGVTATNLVPETNHTVASVFWEYLNSTGDVWDGSEFVEGRLFDPTFFATGYPITEAYWSNVRVGGEEKEVLIQCFERRCLTYTPDNPEGWKVEMGNVGQHYYAWRYE